MNRGCSGIFWTCSRRMRMILPSDPTALFMSKLHRLLDSAWHLGIINETEKKYLWVDQPVIPTLYLLPKVHKSITKPPGRPIVDSSHFIRICQDIKLAPGDLLVTCDVESLYTNIKHMDGMHAVTYFLDLQ
ncbi:uncharacterized protein ACNLHF_015827 [Anomaloglossus baeobatrachus]